MSNTSIDQTELNKFNKTEQEWWDIEGEFRILHQINPLRIDYITSKIQQNFSSKTNGSNFNSLDLLDVGCGGGLVSVPMHKLGLNVTGLDANNHNIIASNDYAKKNKLNITFINGVVEQHLKSLKKYDIILCLEVIEHVSDPSNFIANLDRMLKPNGILIISTINRTLKSYLLAIVVAEYILKWVPQKTHNYSKFLKPSEIVNMSNNCSLNLLELKGLCFSITNNQWQLTNDIDVNYFATFSKTP